MAIIVHIAYDWDDKIVAKRESDIKETNRSFSLSGTAFQTYLLVEMISWKRIDTYWKYDDNGHPNDPPLPF